MENPNWHIEKLDKEAKLKCKVVVFEGISWLQIRVALLHLITNHSQNDMYPSRCHHLVLTNHKREMITQCQIIITWCHNWNICVIMIWLVDRTSQLRSQHLEWCHTSLGMRWCWTAKWSGLLAINNYKWSKAMELGNMHFQPYL